MPVDESGKKKRVPEGLWTKCPKCEHIIYNKELQTNLKVCPKCSHALRVNARERIAMLLEPESFKEIAKDLEPKDVLGFSDTAAYKDRLRDSQKKTGQKDAAVVGEGLLGSHRIALAVLDFEFMGGS